MMSKPTQTSILKVDRDSRSWASGWIDAKGVAQLNEMVEYARAAMAEMTTDQPTVVAHVTFIGMWDEDPKVREQARERGDDWRFEFEKRDGLTASMLERYEAAHDWNLYKNNPFSEVKPANTRRVNNVKVGNKNYTSQHVQNAVRVVQAFDDLLRRAGDTLNGTGWGEYKIDGYRPTDTPLKELIRNKAADLFNPVTPVPAKKWETLWSALQRYDLPVEMGAWPRSPHQQKRLDQYRPFATIEKQTKYIDLTDEQILAFHPVFEAAGAKETGASLRGDGKVHVDHNGPIFASTESMADWIAKYGEPGQRHGDTAVFETHMAARNPEFRSSLLNVIIHVLPTDFGTVAVYEAIRHEIKSVA
jgi:hypothetical protein